VRVRVRVKLTRADEPLLAEQQLDLCGAPAERPGLRLGSGSGLGLGFGFEFGFGFGFGLGLELGLGAAVGRRVHGRLLDSEREFLLGRQHDLVKVKVRVRVRVRVRLRVRVRV
jgi:hypothetical protein